jgi:hypothetical protein
VKTETNVFFCDPCKEDFRNERLLDAHLDKIHQKAAHTPTPVEIGDVISHSYLSEHTDFIIRAVNAHEELLDAVKAVFESRYLDEDGDSTYVIGGDLRKQVKQAIAHAEGRSNV